MDLLETRQYAPYGGEFDAQGTPQTPYGFTGEMTDPNGLVHLRARYLNPQMGTFISPDPMEGNVNDPMSLNPYAYAHGNPANRVDPSGHAPITPQQINNMIQSDPRRFAEMMNSGCIPQVQQPPEPTPTPHYPCQDRPRINPVHPACESQAVYLGGYLWSGPGTDTSHISGITPGVNINPGDRVTLLRTCYGSSYGTTALWYEIKLSRDDNVQGWVWANNIQLLQDGCVPAPSYWPEVSSLNPEPVFGYWGAREFWSPAIAAGPIQYGPGHFAVDVVPAAPVKLSQVSSNPNIFAGTFIYAPFDGTIRSDYPSNYQEFALDLDAPYLDIQIIFSHACPTAKGYVRAGDEIGQLAHVSGTSGSECVDNSLGAGTFAHLHFEVWQRDASDQRVQITPYDYLR
jgi:RHS repeat-associated protein